MFAPFYKVEISTNGKRDDITEYVKSFTYEDATEEDSLMKISVDSSIAQSLADDSRFNTGATIYFQFGFIQGKLSPVHSVRVTDIAVDYGASVSMAITGLDLGNAIKKSSSQKIWKGKTSSQIAREMAASWGLKAEVEDTTKVWEDIPQGNKDDKALLKYLAERETDGDYISFIRNDTLYFVKRALNKKSEFTYTYGEDIVRFKPSWKESSIKPDAIKTKVNVADPLKGVNSKLSNNDSGGGYTGKYKAVYNSSGDRIGQILINNQKNINKDKSLTFSEKIKASMQGIQKSMDFAEQEFGKTMTSPSPNVKENQNLTNSKKKRATLKTLVASLTVNGNPQITPNTVITVSNVAKRHSGNWYVTKVTHKIDQGGYSTDIELSKNAIRDKSKEEAPKAKVNNTIGDKPNNSKNTVKVRYNKYDQNGNKVQ